MWSAAGPICRAVLIALLSPLPCQRDLIVCLCADLGNGKVAQLTRSFQPKADLYLIRWVGKPLDLVDDCLGILADGIHRALERGSGVFYDIPWYEHDRNK